MSPHSKVRARGGGEIVGVSAEIGGPGGAPLLWLMPPCLPALARAHGAAGEAVSGAPALPSAAPGLFPVGASPGGYEMGLDWARLGLLA